MNDPTAQPTSLTAEQRDGLVRAYQRIIAYLAQHRAKRPEQQHPQLHNSKAHG